MRGVCIRLFQHFRDQLQPALDGGAGASAVLDAQAVDGLAVDSAQIDRANGADGCGQGPGVV